VRVFLAGTVKKMIGFSLTISKAAGALPDLLMRAITYKLQERPLGGLSKSILRKLERLNLVSQASGAQKPAPPISKAGTRLVRDGFEWNGQRYRSLTIVAHEISPLVGSSFFRL
jgi:Protein of unknown function (DUF2924)